MTTICSFIQMYETGLWTYLSDVFSYRLTSSELGITNDLIYKIVKFYNGRPRNCEVYAFSDKVYEYRRGADIDLFIEDNGSGNYYFYMLQAKTMDYRGRYLDIKPWSRRAQYYKIIRNAKIENALPLYLLYNGLTTNSNSGNSSFGLSIVPATSVKGFRLRQRPLPRIPSITFNDLHNLNMNPFHVLFCNPPERYTLHGTISRNNIYSIYPYRRITQDIEQKSTDSDLNLNEDNNISNARDNIRERNLALYRVIINSEIRSKF